MIGCYGQLGAVMKGQSLLLIKIGCEDRKYELDRFKHRQISVKPGEREASNWIRSITAGDKYKWVRGHDI